MNAIDKMASVNVLCIGDVMIDRFISGSVRRISPESPVPVLSISSTQCVPGGAANVARNISALGGKCTILSVVGDDDAGRELKNAVITTQAVSCHFVIDPRRPTTEKIRFVSQGQHMLRADNENSQTIAPDTESALISLIVEQLPSHHVVVLSDYAKGVLSDAVIQATVDLAHAHGKPVITDPKSAQLSRYSGATVLTPNAKEAFEATGIEATDSDEQAELAGKKILNTGEFAGVLITRAHRGMSLVTRNAPTLHIPANAREVFDVVGAGDTVVSTLALAIGSGDTLSDAARLANAAAGVVVGKRGTATLSQTELRDAMARATSGQLATIQSKIFALQDLQNLVASWRKDGYSVGFTNGCFDVLHVGHLSILGFSKAHCGRLVVGVNSDASVSRLKGPTRPINPQLDRATVIAALVSVDAVVIFDEDTPLDLITALQPDVLVKGADYTIDKIVGADVVTARGGQVITCELVPGRSSTRTIEASRGNAS